MKKRLFPLLIALAALSVSGSAAFYSVFGLSKLFAGAATQVIIMAGSLEFAKLVVASLLYQYWGTINKWLRGYLMIACFVLMVITSGGIYGFLSGAYQSTAIKSELLDKSLLVIQHKQIRFTETKDDLKIEKNQLTKSISDLRIALSNPTQVQYYDSEAKQVITTSSSSARRALQSELKASILDRDKVNLKLEAVVDSITTTDMALLNKEISNEDQRELGPLKYIASITNWSMDRVVNWFLLLIVFVFDPLAIALIVAANMAFAQIRKPEDSNVPYEESQVETDLDDINDKPIKEVEEEDNTTEPSESLKQRVKENQEKLKENKIDEEEIDNEYFSDLQEYINFRSEDYVEDNLTYPQFVSKHYPEPEVAINTYGDDDWATPSEKEITVDGGEIEVTVEPSEEQMKELEVHENKEPRIITSEEDLNEEELNELSREIGKTETIKEDMPINLTEEELQKLEEILNITYNDEDVPFDRITDTTKTFVDNSSINDDESDDKGSTLRYKGR